MQTKDWINKIHCGNALEVPKQMPDNFVDMIMTSPPYWTLRDYQIEGQLGLEPTFQEYIMKLCDIFDGVKRVLKDTGTIWVNLGDTYNSQSSYYEEGRAGYTRERIGFMRKTKQESKQLNTGFSKTKRYCCNCGRLYDAFPYQYFCGPACSGVDNTPRKEKGFLQDKTLIMIPFRFAIEMVNRGWILRNVIIWYKPNCMPSSAKDRFTVDFEYLFFFSKQKKYYFEQQFEEHKPVSLERIKHKWDGHREPGSSYENMDIKRMCGSEGRNKRCVWDISTHSFPEAHFAVYPEELCITPIKAGCPEFICKKCGKARQKIINNTERRDTRPGLNTGSLKSGKDTDPNKELHKSDFSKYRQQIIYKEKGYVSCKCNAGFESGIVLDLFAGAGTTCLVAKKLGRNYIGIELNPEYVKMAERRIHNQAGLL